VTGDHSVGGNSDGQRQTGRCGATSASNRCLPVTSRNPLQTGECWSTVYIYTHPVMGVAKGGSVGPRTPQSSSQDFFIKDEVVYSTVHSVVYCTEYTFYAHQRWSPRGHGLSLEDPRDQLTMSLVLCFKYLVLALDCQSLALASD